MHSRVDTRTQRGQTDSRNFLHSEVYVSHALPVISQKYLNYFGQLFCSQHGSLFSHYINGNTVMCSHDKRLWNGPDMYQGYVQVKLFNQWETVCPANSPSQVKQLCNAFGFDAPKQFLFDLAFPLFFFVYKNELFLCFY